VAHALAVDPVEDPHRRNLSAPDGWVRIARELAELTGPSHR
jgi:hypothetical protein